MIYTYQPLDKACKSRIGAIARESEITFRIYQQAGGEVTFSAEHCSMYICRDGEDCEIFPMKKTDYGFSLTLKFHRIGLYFYFFRLGEYYLCCGKLRKGTLMQNPTSRWQITVYDEEFETPDWMKGGIMYQIFPDRFNRVGTCETNGKILRDDWGGLPSFRPNENGKVLNNDFFGGNLNGIREKLGYLESLGVTVLYLNPIFEAFSNHRYDTGDYMKIDCLLGTTEDFDNLVADAERHGIRIILDGVFNHTGDISRYFNRGGVYSDSLGAYQSKESPYYSWYSFHDYPNEYDSWWGIDTMPAINERSESYQNFILGENGVLKNWLRHGIAGYRLDVADELPDFFLKKLRTSVKEQNADAMIIGEVWEDASNKIAYGERREYFQGGELDSVMNYPLKNAIIDFIANGTAASLRETIAMLIDNYPQDVLDNLMNILGTHDTPRILTVMGKKYCSDKEQMAVTTLSEQEHAEAKRKLKMAAVLQYTLPGVPCVYYGDENGMEGYSDPFCRRCFDWNNRDEELYLFYKALGKIRHAFTNVFRSGEYREIFADYSCLVYERRNNEGQSVFVYVNNSPQNYLIRLDGDYLEALSGKKVSNTLTVTAYSFGILTKNK